MYDFIIAANKTPSGHYKPHFIVMPVYPTQTEYLFESFRWHDLRHSWASMHAQNGTPLLVLQELGGWSGAQLVQRYAHLANSHLEAYKNNSQNSGTNLAQGERIL
jgi:integrase